jgi:hypothetical protein
LEDTPDLSSPADLHAHECIQLRLSGAARYRWEFERRGEAFSVATEGRLVFDSTRLILGAARAGLAWAISHGHWPLVIWRPETLSSFWRTGPRPIPVWQSIIPGTGIRAQACGPSLILCGRANEEQVRTRGRTHRHWPRPRSVSFRRPLRPGTLLGSLSRARRSGPRGEMF